MPSPTKRMINPRPVRGGDDVGGGGAAARQHQQGYDPTLVGKRTGVTVPPRGQVTFDSPSSGDVLFENPDAFFAAARSGGKKNKSSSSLAGGSDDDAGDNNRRRMSPRGKKGGRQGVEEDKNERRRREREEFEEEARRNAARRPDILQSDEEEDDNEQEDGKPRFKVSSIASIALIKCCISCTCASIGECENAALLIISRHPIRVLHSQSLTLHSGSCVVVVPTHSHPTRESYSDAPSGHGCPDCGWSGLQ
jgi:hypothetical protein